MRYLIGFSYKGTHYHGWQIQPNGVTVQSELTTALSLVLRKEIELTGAGRTDAGVMPSGWPPISTMRMKSSIPEIWLTN